jgi:hypothetical protein
MQFVIEVALALVAALVVDLIKYLLRKRSSRQLIFVVESGLLP